MKKFLKVLGIIAVIIVILFVLLMLMPDSEEGMSQDDGTGLKIGNTAPDFTAQLADGSTFTLSEHSDECVFINFWATWCGPCKEEMPALQKIYDENINGFTMVCIDCKEDKKTVDSFIKESGYTFNIAYDTNGSICSLYPTDGIPYTLIVNKGRIERIFVGSAGAETMYRDYRSAIKDCLGE